MELVKARLKREQRERIDGNRGQDFEVIVALTEKQDDNGARSWSGSFTIPRTLFDIAVGNEFRAEFNDRRSGNIIIDHVSVNKSEQVVAQFTGQGPLS